MVCSRRRAAQRVDHPGHGGAALADGAVDADHVLVALVDDGVHGQRGLAGLAVADDQLALAATDGDQRIDGLDAGLQRHGHRQAIDDRRGRPLDRPGVRPTSSGLP
jgi:hypothetical protein